MNKILLAFLLSISLFSCDEDIPQAEIPFVSFPDIFINLDLPEYQALSIDSGHYDKLGQGVRGIIIYRKSISTYKAFERNCSFQPAEACATISVHNSGLYMFCPCCGSTFSFESGFPTGGPAQYPLREYHTNLSGRSLTVTDEFEF